MPNGSTHYFKFTAVDNAGNESAPSDQQSAQGNLVETANISDAAITELKVRDLAVTNAKIANVSAGKLTAGSISSAEIILGLDTSDTAIIKSSDYSSGSAGWKIDSDGTAEFASATIRGTLNASDITGGTLSADRISAGTLDFNKLSQNSINIVEGMIANNAVTTNKISNDAVTNDKIDSVEFSKVTAVSINANTITSGSIDASNIAVTNLDADNISSGSISGSIISGGTINGVQINAGTLTGTGSLDGLNVGNQGLGLSGTLNLAGNAVTQFGNMSGTGYVSTTNYISAGSYLQGTEVRDADSSSKIDFASTYIDIRPNNQLKYRFSTAQFTSYDDIRPSPSNTYDLGSSTLRWRDIYTFGAVNTSDINLKKDVEDLELGLDFLNTLNPIQFKWDEMEEVEAGIRTHAGFSAQDIEQKLIDYGVESKDYALFTNSQITEETEEPMYGLRSNELIPVLTKAVQELSTQISDLTARVEALEE